MNNLENENEEQIQSIENDYWAGLNKDLVELEQDPRFQRLVLGAYFKDLAINQTSMLASDSTIAEGKRGMLIETLVAISRLQDFFITVKNLGATAPDYESEE